MFFSRLATFAMLALPLLAAATSVARSDAALPPATACCESALSPTSASGKALLGLLAMLGVDTKNANGALGLQCTAVSPTTKVCFGAAMACSKGIVGGVGTDCVATLIM